MTVASCKSAGWGAPGFHGEERGSKRRRRENRGALAPRAVGHWDWCPPPQPTKGLGERRELTQWGPPAANAFLAYLATEQPTKAQFFVKDHSIDRVGGHSGLAGARPPCPPLATGLLWLCLKFYGFPLGVANLALSTLLLFEFSKA